MRLGFLERGVSKGGSQMGMDTILKSRVDEDNLSKLKELNNPSLNELIANAILKFQPRSVFISNGSPEDLYYVRAQAIRHGES